MKKFLLCVLLSILVGSCGTISDSRDVEQITVSGYKGKQIMGKNIFSHIDSLALLSKDGWPMGQIKSACKSDSVVYLLDEVNSIFSFDLQTGLVKNKIHSIGNAKNEYSSLDVICMKDGKVVALDMNSMSVLVFSSNLTFEKRYHLNFPCLDIAPVKGGYLAFNLNASEEKKSVVLLNDNFQEVSSYMDSSFGEEFMSSRKVFTQTNDGAYFMTPKLDDIYQWKGDSLKLAYHIEISDQEGQKNINRKTISFFKIKDNVISTFLSGDAVCFNFYKDGKSTAGLVKLENNLPFMPMFQSDDVLYSIAPVRFKQKNKVVNGYRKEAVLLKCW